MTFQSIIIALWMISVMTSSVLAYTISQPTGSSEQSIVKPFGLQDLMLVSVESTPSPPSPRVTYDLGIGKNSPVSGPSLQPSHSAEFIIQHEAVIDFPHPRTSDEALSKRPKKTLPKIQLERSVTDVLRIDDKSTSPVPVIHATTREQLDMNTVWVEMMIQAERRQVELRSALVCN